MIKTIGVPCNQQKAFTVFVEPRLNGSVTEIGHDDAEHRWGTVTAYDPYPRLALDWHVNMPAENARTLAEPPRGSG